jgi:hypothetical protein
VLAALFAGLLIPIGLAVVLVVRLKQAVAKSRAEIAAFATRHGLTGSVDEPFSLAGTSEGLPLYVTQENIRGERGVQVFTRVRILTGDPAGYRDARPTTTAALAVRRTAALPALDLATGLHDLPTGDAAFDASFRAFSAPGNSSPWADNGVRFALGRMPRELQLVQRSIAECAATFAGTMTTPAVLDRIIQVLAALVSTDRAQRHHAELGAPLDTSPNREDARVRWAGIRFGVVSILGFMAMAPLMFTSVMNDWAANVACKKGETLMMVGNGRGSSARCTDGHGGFGEDANFALFLVSVDTGWAGALAVFSVAEMAMRLGKRRATA